MSVCTCYCCLDGKADRLTGAGGAGCKRKPDRESKSKSRKTTNESQPHPARRISKSYPGVGKPSRRVALLLAGIPASETHFRAALARDPASARDLPTSKPVSHSLWMWWSS
jgi:hypothetical protein